MRSTILRLVIAAALVALPATQAAAYTVNVYDNLVTASLAGADSAIAAGPVTATGSPSIIEFDDLGDATTGHFAINSPFPGGLFDTFAAHATGQIFLPTAGAWTFGLNHDDGARLKIDGVIIASADGVADNRDTLGSATFTAGLHTVDIVFFENAGGASLEFFGAQGTHTAFNTSFALVASVPGPPPLVLLGLGLLGVGFGVRRRPERAAGLNLTV